MSKLLVGATWDDAPHLSEEAKAVLWAGIPPYQREARAKGRPQLGAGAIYPLEESYIQVDDFPIPEHFFRGYGMDVGGGAKPTAAVFAARDNDANVTYITGVYKRALDQPSLHATAIKERMGRGSAYWKWPGVGDAAALILTDEESQQLVRVYQQLDLDLQLADKAVEAGLFDVWEALSLGRLRVFRSCTAWFEEFRMYQRDKKGRIKKMNDHLMDSTRYLVRSGRWRQRPVKSSPGKIMYVDQGTEPGLGWMHS